MRENGIIKESKESKVDSEKGHTVYPGKRLFLWSIKKWLWTRKNWYLIV